MYAVIIHVDENDIRPRQVVFLVKLRVELNQRFDCTEAQQIGRALLSTMLNLV